MRIKIKIGKHKRIALTLIKGKSYSGQRYLSILKTTFDNRNVDETFDQKTIRIIKANY